MKKSLKMILGGSVVLASAGLVACGAGGEDAVVDEFAEAIPNEGMLGLELGEGDQVGQALTVEQGIVGDPSDLRGHAQQAVSRVNEMLRETHARIDALIEDVEPTEVIREGVTCKVWEDDGQRAHWLLTSCRKDARARRFGFVLLGRPLDSTSKGDYVAVFAGEGALLPRFEGARRGAGRVGYNLDNLHSLRGEGPTGKIGIGYRAAGRARQLNIGLQNFQPADAEQDISALYSFKRVVGRGGHLAFNLKADFLAASEEGDLSRGQDGLDEFGRVAVSFARNKAARTVAAVCGGSVGEGRCAAIHQCWVASGEVSYEEIAEDAEATPQWEPTSCPELRESLDAAPSEGEMAPAPTGEDALPAPEVPEPSIDE